MRTLVVFGSGVVLAATVACTGNDGSGGAEPRTTLPDVFPMDAAGSGSGSGWMDATAMDARPMDAGSPDATQVDAWSMDASSCDGILSMEMSVTPPGSGASYPGPCPLPPPVVLMDDGSDPPIPPGIDPLGFAGDDVEVEHSFLGFDILSGPWHVVPRAAVGRVAPDPVYDPTTYQPGSFAMGNYGVSTWVLGADRCADYYDDQGAYLARIHWISFGLIKFLLGYSFAEAQVHAKVDCSADGKGACVISMCGGTTRATGGGYTGPGPNEYWDGDQTDKSNKINNNNSCDLNVGSYSAVSINRMFKAAVTAKIPVNGQGIPIQANADVVYTDNGGVIFGHKLKSDAVVNCKALGVK